MVEDIKCMDPLHVSFPPLWLQVIYDMVREALNRTKVTFRRGRWGGAQPHSIAFGGVFA